MNSSPKDTSPHQGRPRSRWRLWFWRVLRLYLLYLLLLFATQRVLIFPGRFREAPEVAEVTLRHSGGSLLTVPDGGKAWWFAADPERPALVVFHGNGEQIEDWWELAVHWKEAGHGVLLVEYPGYGGVPGPPSAEGMLAHARASLAALRRDFHGPLVGIGVSLGTGVAARLAAEGAFEGLILVAPFTSLEAMAHRRLAPGFLLRNHFDNEQALRQFCGPVLLIHGKDDRVIPASMSAKLRAAASGSAELVLLEKTGHSGVLSGKFLEAVERWLAIHAFSAGRSAAEPMHQRE